jgi:TM2 domain-containing membrane protein YozV
MYAWLVLLHLIGFAVFLLCHAVSMWVAFRIRGEPNRGVISALLTMSSRGNQVMYVGFILLGIGGLGAAAIAGWLTAPWVVASYVVLAVTLVAMWAMGSGFYYPLREGLEGTAKTRRLDDQQLRATLVGSRRPEALAGIGFASLVILVALMVLKPG